LEKVEVKPTGQSGYTIEIDRGNLKTIGETAKNSLSARAKRLLLISNQKVYGIYGKVVEKSLKSSGYKVLVWLMGEGEKYKSIKSVERALNFMCEEGLERTDAVVALGGGVVGDMAGFAAAIYLRGIPFIQVPTTLLAQIDSSVGGKTGVNTPTGKNLVGAFHQPQSVVIDIKTLETLPRREITAGLCEAVKHGAIGSRELFDLTFNFLKRREEADFIRLIASHCAFKASIVAGDERETIDRVDHRSRRILNFGHTVGHALEAITQYRRFRHGEAVGYGQIAAAEISNRMGLLSHSDLELVITAVNMTGKLPRADDLNVREIISLLKYDKKSVGGHIKWILLEEIGRARIVDGREIDPKIIRDSIRTSLNPGGVRAK
jgi:3-dehydroquinate synthase